MRRYPKKEKRIFITGIASGIGRATAEQLLAAGHDVLGIDMNADAPDGARMFVADVTDERAVTAIRDELSAEGVRLDAIVNVAGIHAMCSLVEGDYNKMKRLLEINLCGAMLVNRVLHPLLAEDGRIVIVTSEVAPLDPMPFNGLYNISKTALDCYAQALRQELNLLGQRVITVRPGAIETPLQGGALTATAALAEETELYKRQARHFLSITEKFMGKPMPPERMARTVLRAVTSRRPRIIYSKHRSPGLILLGILPKRLQCTVIRLLLNRR